MTEQEFNDIQVNDRVKTLGTRSYITFLEADDKKVLLLEQNGTPFKYPKALFLQNAVMDNAHNNIFNRTIQTSVPLYNLTKYQDLYSEFIDMGISKEKLDEFVKLTLNVNAPQG